MKATYKNLAEDVNLETLADSESVQALTSDEQTVDGDKTFAEVVKSPNSTENFATMGMDEFVTFAQLEDLRKRIAGAIIESGGDYGLTGDSVIIDKKNMTVTLNPPLVRKQNIGPIIDMGEDIEKTETTESVKTVTSPYVIARFKDLDIDYQGTKFTRTGPMTLRFPEPERVDIYMKPVVKPPVEPTPPVQPDNPNPPAQPVDPTPDNPNPPTQPDDSGSSTVPPNLNLYPLGWKRPAWGVYVIDQVWCRQFLGEEFHGYWLEYATNDEGTEGVICGMPYSKGDCLGISEDEYGLSVSDGYPFYTNINKDNERIGDFACFGGVFDVNAGKIEKVGPINYTYGMLSIPYNTTENQGWTIEGEFDVEYSSKGGRIHRVNNVKLHGDLPRGIIHLYPWSLPVGTVYSSVYNLAMMACILDFLDKPIPKPDKYPNMYQCGLRFIGTSKNPIRLKRRG